MPPGGAVRWSPAPALGGGRLVRCGRVLVGPRGRAGRRGRRSRRSLLVAPLLDAGRLAAQRAQVVELGAPHLAAPDHLDAAERRRVQREDPFDADAARDLAHGEGLAGAAAAPADHHALEDLDAFLVTLDDPHVDAHRVAGAELGLFLVNVKTFHLLQLIHDLTSPSRARRSAVGTIPVIIGQLRGTAQALPARPPHPPPHLPIDQDASRASPARLPRGASGGSRHERPASARPAPPDPRPPAGACSAGGRAGRRGSCPWPRTPPAPPPRAPAATAPRSGPWPAARRRTARSRRSRPPRPPPSAAPARRSPRNGRRAGSARHGGPTRPAPGPSRRRAALLAATAAPARAGDPPWPRHPCRPRHPRRPRRPRRS